MITVPSQSLLGKQKVVFGSFHLHRENDYGILINAEATHEKGSPGVAANNKSHTKKENAKDQEIKEKHKQCLQWQSCVFVVLNSSIRFFVPYDFFFTAGLKLKAGFYTCFCDFPFMIVDTNNSAWTVFLYAHQCLLQHDQKSENFQQQKAFSSQIVCMQDLVIESRPNSWCCLKKCGCGL